MSSGLIQYLSFRIKTLAARDLRRAVLADRVDAGLVVFL